MSQTPGAPIPEFELRYPRAKAILLGVVALYVATVVAVSLFILYTSRRGFTTELAAFWALALLPLALVTFVGPVRTFVRPHEIETRYWRWSQTLKREDILGWLIIGEHLHLERRDRRQPTVTFPLVDPRLREWVTGIDPFDPETYLLQQAEGSQEQRLQSLQSAKRLVRLYLISVGIASVWFLITDGLLPTLILIAAPPAAFLMTAHPSGLIRFQPHYPNPFLGVLPPLFLLLRTLGTASAVSLHELLLLNACAAAPFAIGMAWSTGIPNPRYQTIITILLFAWTYGYGAGMQLNTRFDTAPPETHRVKVIRKYITADKYHTPTLRLERSNNRETPRAVTVRKAAWDRIQPGDTVCIAVHPGALGVAWIQDHTIAACP